VTATALLIAIVLGADPAPVRVGSKNFAESRIVAEIFAQAIEARGIRVERHLGLGGSEVAFSALETGALDAYPEYDGTAWLVLLHQTLPGAAGSEGSAMPGEPDKIDARVRDALAARGVLWLPPLGFSNDWVIAMPEALAAQKSVRTLSDLARLSHSGEVVRAGFSPEFLGREDGLPGLVRVYGLALPEAKPLSEALRYAAIAAGKVDVIDAYSTDARLTTLGLRGLVDDRAFFPPYRAAAIVRADLFSRAPEAAAALLALSGTLPLDTMRVLNQRVERGEDPSKVAADFLAKIGEGRGSSPIPAGRPGLLDWLLSQREFLASLVLRHLELTFASLIAACPIGILLGLLASRRRVAETLILRTVSVLQTIPGLPLLAFLVPWLGIGAWPSLVALFIYGLLPIVQATHAGLTSADPDLVWVAEGQGMTESQIARWVRFPLAAGVMLSGVRVAAVTAVGNATLAAFVGGGGLGEPILAGLTLNDNRLILLGAIPAALLAIAMDATLGALGKRLAPVR
jgi:osmoprotectant transport system permease protein